MRGPLSGAGEGVLSEAREGKEGCEKKGLKKVKGVRQGCALNGEREREREREKRKLNKRRSINK